MRVREVYGIGSYDTIDVADRKERDSLNQINDHFHNVLLPQLQKREETCIDYWPLLMIMWDRQSKQMLINGSSFPMEHGKYGQGYVALTLENLFVISISNLPSRFQKPRATSIFKFFLPVRDRIEPEKEDKMWTIPVSSVQRAEIVTDRYIESESVLVSTNDQAWFMYPFYNHEMVVANGVSLASSGQLNQPLDVEHSDTKHDLIRLLEQLAELRDQGVITTDEFENKKQDLLNRL